jgi:hypothetical protein
MDDRFREHVHGALSMAGVAGFWVHEVQADSHCSTVAEGARHIERPDKAYECHCSAPAERVQYTELAGQTHDCPQLGLFEALHRQNDCALAGLAVLTAIAAMYLSSQAKALLRRLAGRVRAGAD